MAAATVARSVTVPAAPLRGSRRRREQRQVVTPISRCAAGGSPNKGHLHFSGPEGVTPLGRGRKVRASCNSGSPWAALCFRRTFGLSLSSLPLPVSPPPFQKVLPTFPSLDSLFKQKNKAGASKWAFCLPCPLGREKGAGFVNIWINDCLL